MENENRMDELQTKLEELCIERKNIETAIFRQEEKINIRELSKTDTAYKNMEYLKERYVTIDLEINRIKDEIAKLKEEKENPQKSPLQQKEQELSTLEAEEKTISETEALIDKQTEKEGQDIGEN